MHELFLLTHCFFQADMHIGSAQNYRFFLLLNEYFQVILENRLLGEFNDFLLVDREYLKSYVLEYAFRHNYTTNREAIAEAIIDRYTYWPDPSDEDAVRQEFVHVGVFYEPFSCRNLFLNDSKRVIKL